MEIHLELKILRECKQAVEPDTAGRPLTIADVTSLVTISVCFYSLRAYIKSSKILNSTKKEKIMRVTLRHGCLYTCYFSGEIVSKKSLSYTN